jgi:hypothetical protein
MPAHNYYYMQLVVDSDLDDIYADMALLERNRLVKYHGLCQAAGEADVKGGIVRGLTVTKSGAKAINVANGEAKDVNGRPIMLPSVATVSLTNVGDTVAGVGISGTATATGSAVAIGSGKERWLSLWIVYDEISSDPRTDGLGDTVNFRITESFHFHIEIYGSDDSAPSLNRVSLSDNYVFLTDILLDENETIRSITATDVICATSADFDRFGDYASLGGRRSDWLAAENASDFPQRALRSLAIRKGTAREAIIELLKQTEKQTAPEGALLVGAKAVSGALDESDGGTGEVALSLSAGSVGAQLNSLLVALNKKLGRGGGLLKPTAGYDGIISDPVNQSEDKCAWWQKALVGGSVGWHSNFGRKRGHDTPPHGYRTDFTEFAIGNPPTGDIDLTNAKLGPWKFAATGGGSVGAGENYFDLLLASDQLGSGLKLVAKAQANRGIIARLGGSTVGPWRLLGAPWAIAECRFRLITTVTNRYFNFGLNNGTGFALVVTDADGILSAVCKGAAGGAGTLVPLNSGVALLADTWYTLRMASISNQSMSFQLNDLAPVTASCAGANLFDDTSWYTLYLAMVDSGTAAGGACAFSRVSAFGGVLGADEL